MPLAPVPVHSAQSHAIRVSSRALFAFDLLLSAALLWGFPAASPANTLSQQNLTNDIPRQDPGEWSPGLPLKLKFSNVL